MLDLTSARLCVVDVGCGIGQLFVAKGHEIPPGVRRYAFDVDAAAIAYAKERWPQQAEFAVAPAERLPLKDDSVDFYVARVALQVAHIPSVLQEAARVHIPGGRLWITPHPLSMTLDEIGTTVRKLKVKELVMRSIVLVNGLVIQLTGRRSRILGVTSAWQGERGMRRELAADFRDVQVTSSRRHFLIEAIRR